MSDTHLAGLTQNSANVDNITLYWLYMFLQRERCSIYVRTVIIFICVFYQIAQLFQWTQLSCMHLLIFYVHTHYHTCIFLLKMFIYFNEIIVKISKNKCFLLKFKSIYRVFVVLFLTCQYIEFFDRSSTKIIYYV